MRILAERTTYRVVDWDDRFVWLKQNTMFLFANKIAIPRDKVSSVATLNPLFLTVTLVGGETYAVAPGVGKQRARTRDALADHGVAL
jgi:hypothetical protein